MENLFLRLVGDKTVVLKPEQISFKESAVLDGCIRFFDDRNPCFIHKSAVKARYIEEIKSYYRGGEAVLPQAVTDMIDYENLDHAIIFKEEKSK